MPEHGLIHLLELRKENLEIVEITVDKDAACAGKSIREVALPEGSRVISVVRNGKAEIAGRRRCSSSRATRCSRSSSPGKEDELRRVLAPRLESATVRGEPFRSAVRATL